MKRTLIIGDVHGCFDSLMKLLKKVKFDESDDRIIFVGDLIDRGSKVYETVQFVIDLKEKMKDDCIVIRGNHEQMMIDSLNDYESASCWMHNGSKYTLDSIKDKMSLEDLVKWVEDNTVLFHVDEHFNVCHAGTYSDNIESEDADTLTWDRSAFERGLYDGKITIIGHTPLPDIPVLSFNRKGVALKVDKWSLLPAKGLIDIDTGCVFGYKLTCMIIQENEEGKPICVLAQVDGDKHKIKK